MSCSHNNSHEEILNTIKDYIAGTKWVALASVAEDSKPALRTLGSVVNDDLDIYFSTGKNTAKVAQIAANPFVTLLFQHEDQELATFKNVTYTGEAKQLSCEKELAQAIELLSNHSPRFKTRAEKGELGETAIFKVKPVSIKYLDFSSGVGSAAVKEVTI